MKFKAITAKEAEKITLRNGMCWTADGSKTFYLTDEDETEVWEYSSKTERDRAVRQG